MSFNFGNEYGNISSQTHNELLNFANLTIYRMQEETAAGVTLVNVYSTTKETRQFLICPRFAYNLVQTYYLVICHDKQLG